MLAFKEEFEKLVRENNEMALVYLEKYLEDFPNDIQAKLSYALFVQSIAFDDYLSALKVTADILSGDSCNIQAIILQAFIEDFHLGEIGTSTLELINKAIADSKTEKYAEQLFLFKAFYYRNKDQNNFIEALLESIENDETSFFNYYFLALEYNRIGEKERAYNLLNKGVGNINKVLTPNDYNSPIDYNGFIQEKVRGVWATVENYNSYKENIL